MSRKYSKKWFKVHGIISRAQKEIYEIVEDMCRMLKEDIGEELDKLSRRYGFTYVIKPREGNGDIMKCVPCVYIKASKQVVEEVRKAITSKFTSIVSDSRVVFEQKPVEIPIQ